MLFINMTRKQYLHEHASDVMNTTDTWIVAKVLQKWEGDRIFVVSPWANADTANDISKNPMAELETELKIGTVYADFMDYALNELNPVSTEEFDDVLLKQFVIGPPISNCYMDLDHLPAVRIDFDYEKEIAKVQRAIPLAYLSILGNSDDFVGKLSIADLLGNRNDMSGFLGWWGDRLSEIRYSDIKPEGMTEYSPNVFVEGEKNIPYMDIPMEKASIEDRIQKELAREREAERKWEEKAIASIKEKDTGLTRYSKVTYRMAEAAIEKNCSRNYSDVPGCLWDESLLKKAIVAYPYCAKTLLPKYGMSGSGILEIISENATCFSYIPEDMLTPELAEMALKEAPDAVIQYCNNNTGENTEKLRISLVTAKPSLIYSLKEETVTEKVLAAAMEKDPLTAAWAYGYTMPIETDEQGNPRRTSYAVRDFSHDIVAFKSPGYYAKRDIVIPSKSRHSLLMLEDLRKAILAYPILYSLTGKLGSGICPKTDLPHMGPKLLKEEGMLLSIFTDEEKTAEMCLDAVRSYPKAMRWVPADLQTPEMLQICVASGIENCWGDKLGNGLIQRLLDVYFQTVSN